MRYWYWFFDEMIINGFYKSIIITLQNSLSNKKNYPLHIWNHNSVKVNESMLTVHVDIECWKMGKSKRDETLFLVFLLLILAFYINNKIYRIYINYIKHFTVISFEKKTGASTSCPGIHCLLLCFVSFWQGT